MRGRRPSDALRAERPPPAAALHRPGLAVVRDRVDVAARRLAERSTMSSGSLSAAASPTVRTPVRVQLARRRRPDAPDALDRQRVQELELAARRHDEQPVGLRRAARDLRQHLRARDADAQRQPDLLAHLAPQQRARARPRRLGRAGRRRGTPPPASRARTTSTCAVEDREHRPARLRCTPPTSASAITQPRAQPPRPGRRHPAADAERARLVARRHDDPDPTTTGRPRSDGSSRWATEAKNASTSAWSTMRTHVRMVRGGTEPSRASRRHDAARARTRRP